MNAKSTPTVVLDLDGRFAGLMDRDGRMLPDVKFVMIDTVSPDSVDDFCVGNIHIERFGSSKPRHQHAVRTEDHVFDQASIIESLRAPAEPCASSDSEMDFGDAEPTTGSPTQVQQRRTWSGAVQWAGCFNQSTYDTPLLEKPSGASVTGYTRAELSSVSSPLYVPTIPPRFLSKYYHLWFPSTRYYTPSEHELQMLPTLHDEIPSTPLPARQHLIPAYITAQLNTLRNTETNAHFWRLGYEIIPDFVSGAYQWRRRLPQSIFSEGIKSDV